MVSEVVWWVFEESVQLAGDVAFKASAGFAGGFALAGAFLDVGPGFGAGPGAADGDGVESSVELTVASSVQSVAGVLPGGRFEGCYAG